MKEKERGHKEMISRRVESHRDGLSFRSLAASPANFDDDSVFLVPTRRAGTTRVPASARIRIGFYGNVEFVYSRVRKRWKWNRGARLQFWSSGIIPRVLDKLHAPVRESWEQREGLEIYCCSKFFNSLHYFHNVYNCRKI